MPNKRKKKGEELKFFKFNEEVCEIHIYSGNLFKLINEESPHFRQDYLWEP